MIVEVEYVVDTEVGKEIMWIQLVVKEMIGHKLQSPITLYSDNNGSIALSKNPEFHAYTKYINIKYHFIIQLVSKSITIIKYLSIEVL